MRAFGRPVLCMPIWRFRVDQVPTFVPSDNNKKRKKKKTRKVQQIRFGVELEDYANVAEEEKGVEYVEC